MGMTMGTLTMEAILDAQRRVAAISPAPSMRLLPNMLMTKRELIRMCKSKRRRIRKKWLKNPKNYRTVPDPSVYITPLGIVGHPSVLRRIMPAKILSPLSSYPSSCSLDIHPSGW